MEKIVIIGSSGQLGSALAETLGSSSVVLLSHDQIEIGDLENTKHTLEDLSPEIIINTAAFHNVLLCEEDSAKSFLINCTAVKALANTASKLNATLVHISTDYIFGLEENRSTAYNEEDPPGPVNIYGVSKLAGEYAVLYTHPRAYIFRTSGLYGLQGAASKGGNFVDKRIRNADEVTELTMSSEQKLTPTFTKHLANNICEVIFSSVQEYGIYHATCEGECSWAEFTQEIYKIMGFNVKVIPTDRGGYQNGVRKPLYCVLDNTRLKKRKLNLLPDWRESLAEYLKMKH